MQHRDDSSQEAWLIVDGIIGKLFYSTQVAFRHEALL